MSHIRAERKPANGTGTVTTVLDVLGAGLIVAGVWCWSVPAGLVAAGVSVLVASWRMTTLPRGHR
jgi:hypothetical protein